MRKLARNSKGFGAQMVQAAVSAGAGLIVLASLLAAALVHAETYSSNPHKTLEEKIAAALSGGGAPVTVQNVQKTPANGLLEMTLDNGLVLYATEQGDHFVVGDLYAVR